MDTIEDINKLFDKYSAPNDNDTLVTDVRSLLDILDNNHIIIRNMGCNWQGVWLTIRLEQGGGIQFHSNYRFKFPGMRSTVKTTVYTKDKIHLLPVSILSYLKKELSYQVDKYSKAVYELYHDNADSVFAFTLSSSTENNKGIDCLYHYRNCGELMTKTKTLMLSLVHEITTIVGKMSISVEGFDDIMLTRKLPIGEIKIYSHPSLGTTTGGRTNSVYLCALDGQPLYLRYLMLSIEVLESIKELVKLRDYLRNNVRLQPIIIDIDNEEVQ